MEGMFSRKSQKWKSYQIQTMQNKISRCWKVIFPHLSLIFQIFYHQKWLKYQHSKLNLVLFLLVLNMKTVCGVAAAGITLLTVREILTRWSTYDQLVTCFQGCVLPAGSRLIEVGQGCVCFTIQVDNLTGLTAVEHVRGWHAQGTFI